MKTVNQSPGLELFRANPFRILRIAIGTPTRQAVWRGEKLLARVRAGAPLPGNEPVPWLEGVDALELQRAIQQIEEPLPRIVAQCLWFDFEEDPQGGVLEKALVAGDLPGLARYLVINEDEMPGLPVLREDAPLTELQQVSERRLQQLIPHRVNQANVRLLLGLCRLSGIELDTRFGQVPMPLSEPESENGRVTSAESADSLAFRRENALNVARDVHLVVAPTNSAGDAGAEIALLRQALRGWASLVTDPRYHAYLKSKIEHADDELLSEDDSETILTAVLTRITDTIVAEMKAALLSGDQARVAHLIGVISHSGMERQSWSLALPPLRALFRTEIEELESLLEASGSTHPDEISQYLGRVMTLRKRWESIDQANILGLQSTLDQAVSRALRKIEDFYQASDQLALVDELADLAHETASAGSLKARIEAFKDKVASYRKVICQFCSARGGSSEYSAVVTGKRLLERTHQPNGQIVVRYGLQGRLLPRCEPCAVRHGFVFAIGRLTFLIIALAGVGYPLFALSIEAGSDDLLILLLATPFIALVARLIAQYLTSWITTPDGNRNLHDYSQTSTYSEMIGEQLTVSCHLGLHAVKRLEESEVAAMHDRVFLSLIPGDTLSERVFSTLAVVGLQILLSLAVPILLFLAIQVCS